MNTLFQQHLDSFVTIYLDDLLIYSETLREHEKYVRTVLEKLREAGLLVDIDKCEFHMQEVKYLGLIITLDRLKIDSVKVEAI
jgi:EAL domain-containing protein (putative c-di-GMP-specific phosphodiesterase class I)